MIKSNRDLMRKKMKNIDELRKDIESIDEEILRLISIRLEISKMIAEKKKKTGIPLEDNNREIQLEKLWIKKAKEFGIGTANINKILKDVLNLSKKEQKKLFINTKNSGKKCTNL